MCCFLPRRLSSETLAGVSLLKVIVMNKNYRISFAIGVSLMILVYFFPIWTIELQAPQYPEGLGFNIWAYKLTGFNEYDLENINKLNHYIGMKEINENSIPELQIIPVVIGIMLLTGFLVVKLNKFRYYQIWTLLLFIVLVAGLVDFYIWEYDYGHDLNPMAAIKIPGMSYQPPLIGSEQILNMNAISLPAVGGIAPGITLLIGIITIFLQSKINRKSK